MTCFTLLSGSINCYFIYLRSRLFFITRMYYGNYSRKVCLSPESFVNTAYYHRKWGEPVIYIYSITISILYGSFFKRIPCIGMPFSFALLLFGSCHLSCETAIMLPISHTKITSAWTVSVTAGSIHVNTDFISWRRLILLD